MGFLQKHFSLTTREHFSVEMGPYYVCGTINPTDKVLKCWNAGRETPPQPKKTQLCKHKTLAGRRSGRQPISFAHHQGERVRSVVVSEASPQIRRENKEEKSHTLASSRTLDTKPNVGYFIKLQADVVKVFPAEVFLLIAPPAEAPHFLDVVVFVCNACRTSPIGRKKGEKNPTLDPFYHFVCHWGEKWVEKL